MRALFVIGLLLVVLGIGSLFVPIATREKHGVKVGNASIGFETTRRRKVEPLISAVMIGAGVLLVIAGANGRKR